MIEARRPLRTTTSATAITDVAAMVAMSDRVLVRVDATARTTDGGLITTRNEKERPKTGTVIGVGPGRYTADGMLEEGIDFFKVGDRVLWKNDFGSDKIQNDDGDDLISLREFSIVAKF